MVKTRVRINGCISFAAKNGAQVFTAEPGSYTFTLKD
jgi:hypothetical protein